MLKYVLNFVLSSKKKPEVPETLLKKKKQREELLQKRVKTAALLKKVYKFSMLCCVHSYNISGSAEYAVKRCLSAHLSQAGILSKKLNISEIFTSISLYL